MVLSSLGKMLSLKGGASTFDALTDTPASKIGSASKFPRVKSDETAIEYIALAGGGDVLAPATNTDSKVPQWDGADAKTLKDGLLLTITVGDPGADTTIVSEQGIREALDLLGGDVVGPIANTDGNIPQWNGTDSKTLKNGLTVNTVVNDPGLDTEIVTGKAVRDAIDVIGDKTVKATYFTTIASGTTSGTITKPAGTTATLVMDEWGTDTDALLSTIVNGKPTFKSPVDASGDPITTTFNTNGDYSFSATPSPAADHALIYVYTCKLSDFLSAEALWEAELLGDAVLLTDFDAQSILAATTKNTPAALVIAEQKVVGRLTGGNIDGITLGIADNNIIQIDQVDAASGEIARLTANGIESRSDAEMKSQLGYLTDVIDDTSPTLGGDLDVGAFEILLDTTPGSDVTASGLKGVFTNGNAGSVNFGDICYMAADGDLEFVDADAETTGLGLFMSLATIVAGNPGEWLFFGIARNDAWNWTPGGVIYCTVTATTGNTLSQTPVVGNADIVFPVGIATHADRVYFNPGMGWVELVI